jgi:hypothetical protein
MCAQGQPCMLCVYTVGLQQCVISDSVSTDNHVGERWDLILSRKGGGAKPRGHLGGSVPRGCQDVCLCPRPWDPAEESQVVKFWFELLVASLSPAGTQLPGAPSDRSYFSLLLPAKLGFVVGQVASMAPPSSPAGSHFSPKKHSKAHPSH